MTERHFTPEDVEALIPTLTALVDRLRAAHDEGRVVREYLESEQRRVSLSGGGMLDQARWRAAQARFDAATKDVKAVVDELGALGGTPKDVELGLVDFPHLRDGRVVNLCWKYGETRVRWWHGFDEGYAGRKPL